MSPVHSDTIPSIVNPHGWAVLDGDGSASGAPVSRKFTMVKGERMPINKQGSGFLAKKLKGILVDRGVQIQVLHLYASIALEVAQACSKVEAGKTDKFIYDEDGAGLLLEFRDRAVLIKRESTQLDVSTTGLDYKIQIGATVATEVNKIIKFLTGDA